MPWDSGWSATVNGEEVPIEQANVGFMAVRVPAGQATIEFAYHTPGLALSAGISLTALAVYGVYLLLLYYNRKRKSHAESC